jgi:hypothetical protein
MWIAYLWESGWRGQSILRCGLAGLALCGGLLLSLAFLPVLLLVVTGTMLESLCPSQPTPVAAGGHRRTACAVVAGITFALPVLALQLMWDLNLLRVWQWNLHNHAQFYAHVNRTYWAWLLVNPAELFFGAGAPLSTLALLGIRRSWRSNHRHAAVLAFWIVWSLLWVSGKNMGEAARLWLLLMPWLVLSAATALRSVGLEPESRSGDERAQRPVFWLVVVAIQAVTGIATVTGVDGFQFAELPPVPPT